MQCPECKGELCQATEWEQEYKGFDEVCTDCGAHFLEHEVGEDLDEEPF